VSVAAFAPASGAGKQKPGFWPLQTMPAGQVLLSQGDAHIQLCPLSSDTQWPELQSSLMVQGAPSDPGGGPLDPSSPVLPESVPPPPSGPGLPPSGCGGGSAVHAGGV
jgi:hypothetical protein